MKLFYTGISQSNYIGKASKAINFKKPIDVVYPNKEDWNNSKVEIRGELPVYMEINDVLNYIILLRAI